MPDRADTGWVSEEDVCSEYGFGCRRRAGEGQVCKFASSFATKPAGNNRLKEAKATSYTSAPDFFSWALAVDGPGLAWVESRDLSTDRLSELTSF
jgi:hypothetical protein